MDKSTPKPKTVMKKTQTCNIHFRTNNFFFVDNYYNVQFFSVFVFRGFCSLFWGFVIFVTLLYFLLFYLFFIFFFIFFMIAEKNTHTKLHLRQNSFDWDLKTPDTHTGFLSSETDRRDQSPWILVWEYRPTKQRRQGRLSKGETYRSILEMSERGLSTQWEVFKGQFVYLIMDALILWANSHLWGMVLLDLFWFLMCLFGDILKELFTKLIKEIWHFLPVDILMSYRKNMV